MDETPSRQNDIVRGGGEVKKNISLPRWMNFFPNPTRWREKSREQGHVVGEIRELSQVILTRKSRAICTSKHVPRRSRSEVHRNFRKRTSSKKARKFRCFLLCACFPRFTAAVPQNAARAIFARTVFRHVPEPLRDVSHDFVNSTRALARASKSRRLSRAAPASPSPPLSDVLPPPV